MIGAIKLSAPETRGFWEIPVLYEDAQLLALDKPAGLAVEPDPAAPDRPALTTLLHAAIREGKVWTRERGIDFVLPAHRLDDEASGVLLLARSKEILAATANYFGSSRPGKEFLALVHGDPPGEQFEVEAKLGPHPLRAGLMRVDPRRGKKSKTACVVTERFRGCCLVRCDPLSGRLHQVRVHLRHAGFPVVGDTAYGGKPLLLSRLKKDYHLKPDATERPLVDRPALHAERLRLPHPVTGETLEITAPIPKMLRVALKYLRRYAV